jgi:transcriptional regulator with XRE-family HTH domain
VNRYRLLRFERGLEIEEVAQGAGLHRHTVRRLETGETPEPSAATAKALADFYGISVPSLLGIDSREAA